VGALSLLSGSLAVCGRWLGAERTFPHLIPREVCALARVKAASVLASPEGGGRHLPPSPTVACRQKQVLA